MASKRKQIRDLTLEVEQYRWTANVRKQQRERGLADALAWHDRNPPTKDTYQLVFSQGGWDRYEAGVEGYALGYDEGVRQRDAMEARRAKVLANNGTPPACAFEWGFV